MIPPRAPLKLTYDDYLVLPDDGRRRELVEGEEHVSPQPTVRHQRVVARLLARLGSYVEEHGGGEVFVAVDVLLSDVDVVRPDLAFVAEAHAGRVRQHGVVGAPDLVVEVLSEGHRRHDELRKRRLYERFGVGEYWIVDPELELVKVYRRGGESFEPKVEWSREAGDALSTPLVPGFELPLALLFGRHEGASAAWL